MTTPTLKKLLYSVAPVILIWGSVRLLDRSGHRRPGPDRRPDRESNRKFCTDDLAYYHWMS